MGRKAAFHWENVFLVWLKHEMADMTLLYHNLVHTKGLGCRESLVEREDVGRHAVESSLDGSHLWGPKGETSTRPFFNVLPSSFQVGPPFFNSIALLFTSF
jgi:hypothetical protein